MPSSPEALPNRRSIRLQGWDYSSPGLYFLTVSTKGMRSVFGTVAGGRMVLNAAGASAERCWREIPAHFPHVALDEYVVMPNHVHGLLRIVGTDTACRVRPERRLEGFGKPVAGSVSTIMRSYKGAVTRELGEKVWLGRFYDVLARDEAARANIRAYIRSNPENCGIVVNASEPEYVGNRELSDLPKVGFLASRGGGTPHGALPLRTGEAVISGFLSPMERAVFDALLRRECPLVWVRAGGPFRKDTACRVHVQEALAAGRLLIVSPFPAEAPNERRAVWCNQYVLANCERLVVGRLKPDGMLACVLSEANPAMPVTHLDRVAAPSYARMGPAPADR